ncbi:sugar kinase [Clostridium massiliodielmoense]|uniref:sugar kinase n=1 Tax=Clostridium massiliodielmoense TaxID=1776385 RepID=UPI000166A145|nr:sugar kinase [Clostridium massiliodielmoense]EDS77474.1 2-dehydro-3-deoxygluconokinase [Clostridium botulinum C str. Eklund]KEH98666.1 2-dehydro-3-deoxygluconokinase [Clostridium botulinum C/D str. BKT12695]NEZ49889.1 sugar kinase [Clostridium botulinum]
MCEVITMGEPMTLFAASDIMPLEESSKFIKFLSGAEVNVAIGLSRLNHKVSYITQLKDDAMGIYIYNCLKKENIDTSYIRFVNQYFNGIQIKERVAKGDPRVINIRKNSASANINKNIIKDINFKNVKWIHITGIPLGISQKFRETIIEFVKTAKKLGIKVCLDPNLRTHLWESNDKMIEVINNFAKLADIIIPGINEGYILTGMNEPEKIADFYLNIGVQQVIIKLGEKGAYIKEKDKQYVVDGFKVKNVIDTVGAGDGFAVGVLSGLLEGLSLTESVLRGNAIGAIQVMSLGDNDGLPTREELHKFMSKLEG